MSRPLPHDAMARLAPYVPREDLQAMRVVTGVPGRWIPWALRAGATTLGRYVFFREGRFRPDTARGLALIAHEAGHVRQWRQLGVVRFLLRYGRGLVASRFQHARHPMEAPLNEAQARILGLLEASGV
jgi:hypothetical protein